MSKHAFASTQFLPLIPTVTTLSNAAINNNSAYRDNDDDLATMVLILSSDEILQKGLQLVGFDPGRRGNNDRIQPAQGLSTKEAHPILVLLPVGSQTFLIAIQVTMFWRKKVAGKKFS
jgi:hypothetical protein